MDETNGSKLIEMMKKDKEKFRKEHGGYQLLTAYFNGFPKETLRNLLCDEDKDIRGLALWIIYELGRGTSRDFLEEVTSQMNGDDPGIYFWAAEIVARYGTGKYMDDFMKIFCFFEHPDAKIRRQSMGIISMLNDSRIRKAYAYSVMNKILSDSHEKSLLSLLHINTLTASDIAEMLHSDDSIIRKYGVIAAEKVYDKHPEIIRESVNSEDLDVREYSKMILEIQAEKAKRYEQWRNRKRNAEPKACIH
ncbi:MAG: hypothetical protein NC548_50390 [Lachnospiraceae bacterium]|nr:hypothetical protein [Lachnospiraceae bacterium]